jgi:hypothetical protein
MEDILNANQETACLDFKRTFEPASLGDWLELIKDIVAMANSGGGTIIVGVENDGANSFAGAASSFLAIDPADFTNKIYKYTECHFADFQIARAEKANCELAVLVIKQTQTPLVFTKEGGYTDHEGRSKRAFAAGTVYFRHGAKSEPGNSNDLKAFVERCVENIRKTWLDGIAKVVEAPPGAKFQVVTVNSVKDEAPCSSIRLVEDPNAAPIPHIHVDRSHPHRQKEVVILVNQRLQGRRTITSFNIVSIRRVHEIHKNLMLCYTQNYASPRYSDAFIDWIVEAFERDPSFFEKYHKEYDRLKAAAAVEKQPQAFAV